jgi:hypothetical protein
METLTAAPELVWRLADLTFWFAVESHGLCEKYQIVVPANAGTHSHRRSL